MTRIEILKIRLDQLEKTKESLESRTSALRRRSRREVMSLLESRFKVSNPTFKVTVKDEDTVSLHRADKSDWHDFCSLRLRMKYSRGNDNERFTSVEVYHNGATFTELGDWMIEQLDAKKEFMQCAIDHGKSILADANSIYDKYQKLINTFYPKLKEITNSISNQNSDIRKLEKEAMLVKLSKKGISFIPDDRGRLPEMDVKFDWTLRNVEKIKVLRTSASGKSADIEVTRKYKGWYDDSNDPYKFETVKVDRVRLDKVDSFLRVNNKLIK